MPHLKVGAQKWTAASNIKHKLSTYKSNSTLKENEAVIYPSLAENNN